MEYLLINGSPHLGNTWKIAELVASEIAAQHPDAHFHTLHLARLGLGLCEGCSACFRKGGAACPHRDVMDDVLAMMAQADGLIFVATTFNRMPNALAKNLLDHLCYLLHRPRFFTNKALVISSTGGVGAGKTVKYVAGTLEGLGYNRCYRLPVMAFSWNDLRPGDNLKKKCRKAALRFSADVNSGKLHAPKWTQLMVYNLFRGMSRGYAPGTSYETEDGSHWTQKVRAHSPYDPAIPLRNPFKWLFAQTFFAIGLLGSKLTTVTYRK